VCLTTQGGVSLEMERYFAQLQGGPGEPLKAERVLELNAGHPVFQTLKTTMLTDKDKARKYAELLYGQSQLVAGVPLDDPTHFAGLVSELMV
jgi:molecular chaperone HtpG